MAKLTELLKAIAGKKILANESTESLFAVLVRVDADFDQENCVYRSYDVQVVLADIDGNVKKSAVINAEAPEWDDSIENTVELTVRTGDVGTVIGISYYDKEADGFLCHEEVL